jgi:hypothetical protein
MGARLQRALAKRFGGEGRVTTILATIAGAGGTPRRSAAQVLASRAFGRRRLALRFARATRGMRGVIGLRG